MSDKYKAKFFPYFHIFVLTIIPFTFLLDVDILWYVVWGFMHFFIITFGVHFTFHRLIAHKVFKTYKIVEWFGSFVGSLSVTGSPLGWSIVHMQHHIHSDTDKDPHSPRHHGMKIILGFLDYSVFDKRSLVPVKHVKKDSFHIFFEKFYLPILLAWWTTCYLMFGLEGLLFLGLLPSCTSGVATMASNYILHSVELQHKQGISPNNPFMWLLVFGEIAHREHHKKLETPFTATYLDPTNYYIKLLRKHSERIENDKDD